MRSPVGQKYSRELLKTASSFAAALALKQSAEALPPGRTRNKITKWARRTEGCAVSRMVRLINRKNDVSFVLISNKRACSGRWCPPCAARKAATQVKDAMELMDHIWSLSPGARVLMLTLTSKNRLATADQTRQFVLDHQKALKAFFAYYRIKIATLGHLTNIEVGFARLNGQLTSHVHSHSLVVVEKGALSDHRYIRHAEYRALWQRAIKAPYRPQVRISAVKSSGSDADWMSLRGAVAEVCKYNFAADSYFSHVNGVVAADPDAALALALATYRRRLTSMDRIWLEAKKRRARLRKPNAQSHSESASEI
jgi:plasmid rolling circle replication initiator protein Rep